MNRTEGIPIYDLANFRAIHRAESRELDSESGARDGVCAMQRIWRSCRSKKLVYISDLIRNTGLHPL